MVDKVGKKRQVYCYFKPVIPHETPHIRHGVYGGSGSGAFEFVLDFSHPIFNIRYSAPYRVE